MKKTVKWMGIVLLTPILLFVVLALLFYFPPFQRWAVRQAADYAAEKTGLEISIHRVRLAFPLDLSIEGVKVLQQNDSLSQVKDTVANIGNAVADVRLLPLLGSRVEVDGLELKDVRLNTAQLIHEVRVKGVIGRLFLQSRGIDLKQKTLHINQAILADASVSVELSDTVPPDTTKSEVFWKILVDSINVTHTTAVIHMPGDTLQVKATMEHAMMRTGYFDLYKNLYQVGSLDWIGGEVTYDQNFEPRTKGLDANHLHLTQLVVGVDSFFFCQPELRLRLRACSFKEKSGVTVSSLTGNVALDSVRLHLPNLVLRTPESMLTADFRMDMNTFAQTNPGKMNATLHGSFGKHDLMLMMGKMPQGFRRQWPNRPLTIDGVVRGNLQRIAFTGLSVKLPTAFRLNASGYVENPIDEKNRRAEIYTKVNTYQLGFVTSLLDKDLQRTVRIPTGMGLDGKLNVNGATYSADLTLRESRGLVRAKATIDTKRMAYTAKIRASNFALQHFMPHHGLHAFTGYVEAKGVGTDMLSPRTHLEATARIERFQYGNYPLDHISADASLRNGVMTARLDSKNPLLQGNVLLLGQTTNRQMKAHISCHLPKADLYHLNILDQNIQTALLADVDVESNWKDAYRLEGKIHDITVIDKDKDYQLGAILFNAFTNRDTTHAALNCGDFSLKLTAKGGYERLLHRGKSFWNEMEHQLKSKHINETRLRERLPLAGFYLQSGKNNLFMRILRRYGFDAGEASVNLTSSPQEGLNGHVSVNSLLVDSVLLDTIRFRVRSDKAHMVYAAQVRNNKKNPQYVFNALFDGALEERGTYLKTRIYDANDKLGLRLGVKATMEANGIQLSIIGDKPVLGYKTFAVNDSNYVFLGDDRRVRADMKLLAADGTGVQLLTNNDNTDVLQDITLTLNRFSLEKIFDVLPYTPDLSGTLNGDFHIIQTKTELSISSAVSITDMVYQQCPMGDLSTEFVYMPKTDGSHYIDGMLMHNDYEVGRLSGTYYSKGGGTLDATFSMDRLPMFLANGFIPKRVIGFKGYGEGELTIQGSLNNPRVNGEVYLDSTSMFSEPYGVELRFANDPVRIVNSRLLFENFEVYANNDSPLNVAGTFDFSDLNHMTMDVRMRATNYEIIDAKENYRSEVYGKVFVNFYGQMQGELSNLQLRGKLDVLDATDMTYVLRDSPLTTDNQLDELVMFTDFSDSTKTLADRPPLTGFNMSISIDIDPNAHILCALNADKSNYIDLMGGGELRMSYNPMDELRLIGRYTLNNGQMKYSLPVIPLKTFTIKDGSYIEFTGDPMNPRLNITATETAKASVSTNGRDSRIVEFECGVIVTKTLKNMGLEFIIDAPQDMTVSNQLNTMGREERGKLAVTMLTTGMYLADGNTRGFSMNNALSAFLQSQINNITGNALRTLDLSFGLDNVTDASGNMHTDYSFKFAKRLWNNRLRIIIGGKVSSGADVTGRENTFFDNVSFEYRLNKGSTRYMQLFYNRDSYDWLEGDIGKYGFGFIWRRKLRHFRDIFRLKNTEEIIFPQTDSLNVKGNEPKQ